MDSRYLFIYCFYTGEHLLSLKTFVNYHLLTSYIICARPLIHARLNAAARLRTVIVRDVLPILNYWCNLSMQVSIEGRVVEAGRR